MNAKRMILLCLALAVVLCGCAGASGHPAGTVTPAQTEAPAETEAQQQTQPQKQMSLGEIRGGTYENEYLGYGCALDETWTYQTAEELQDITALTQELMEGTDLEGAADSYTQIMDIMAENAQKMLSMNVVFTRLSPQEQLAAAMMSEEQFLEGVLSYRDSVIEAYANAGMEVTSMQIVPITFLGEERLAIRTEGSTGGVPYYMVQVYSFNLGGAYNAVLTLSSFMEDQTDMLLALFYPL